MAAAGGRITAGVGANLIGQHAQDRNQEATVYVGNLDPQMTEELVWELFVQAGPMVNVYLPKDRITNNHQGYGFVEYRTEEDADYAIKVLNMIKVYGKPIRVNKASQDKRTQDVGANLFIGNLDPEVDEKLLYDTFSAFGVIAQTPKIMRDPETGVSRGFGFVSYDSFEASDAAIEAMNGQFLCNRAISVGYAFKKDTKGERHGTPAERRLAETKRVNMSALSRPNQLFATGPKQRPEPGQQLEPPLPAPAALALAPPPAFPPPPTSMANSGSSVPGMPPPPGMPRLPAHTGMPPPPVWGGSPGMLVGAPPQPWGLPPPLQQQQQQQPPSGMRPPMRMPPPPQGMGGPLQGMGEPPHGMPAPPHSMQGPPPPYAGIPPWMAQRPPGMPQGAPPPPWMQMPPPVAQHMRPPTGQQMPPPGGQQLPPWMRPPLSMPPPPGN